MNRPALEVADVVRQYGAAYLSRYGSTLSTEQHRALRAIAVCRTAALGGHATQCDQCGHLELLELLWQSTLPEVSREGTSRLARSPRGWSCSMCPTSMWYLLSRIPSAHSRSKTAGEDSLLFQAVAETLLTVARDPHYLGADIGFLAVLHTWGQTLHHHPHLHCVVPGGGLSPDGTPVGSLSASILPPGPCPESGVPSSVPHLAPSGLHGRC